MSSWNLVALLLAFLLVFSLSPQLVVLLDAENSSVIELSDANFEHDTQAATGQTTGRWFVLFSSQQCQSCSSIEEELGIACSASGGSFVAAKVDIHASPITAKRFNFTDAEIPQLLLFRDRKLFKFAAKEDTKITADYLTRFAQEGYLAAEELPIPREPGLVDRLLKLWMEKVDPLIHQAITELANNRVLLIAAGLLVALGCYWLVSMLLFRKPNARKPMMRGGVRRKGPNKRPKAS